jgi:drug/metabolite transporter (DMT)-like permease
MDATRRIAFLVFAVSITGATQRIIVTFLAQMFPSMIFVILVSGAHFCIVFGLILLFLARKDWKLLRVPEKKTILIAGLCNAFAGIFTLYAANPIRTPAVVQSILPGLAVIPSIIMTKYILKKNVFYEKWYIVPSLIFLFTSVGISIIPIYSHWSPSSILWIAIFTIGTTFRSGHNVMQEKYITDTRDGSFLNMIRLVFYIRLVQFVVVVAFSWLDIFFGYSDNIIIAFRDSGDIFVHKLVPTLLLEIFTASYICLFVAAVYLNAISTNYNMISTSIVNPSTAIFYSVFPDLNPGLDYPLYIMIPALVASLLSVALWIKGERKEPYETLTESNSAVDMISLETGQVHV